jgi:hypothetical protein
MTSKLCFPWQWMFFLVTLNFSALAEGAEATTHSASKFPCDPEKAAHYTAYRVSEKINIDGQLAEKSWAAAPRSPRFTDILTGNATMYDTRAAVLWDEENLYVGYWVEEPNVKATFTDYGSPIYYNNDVEMFIAGKDAYYEFEINALNTVYEAFFMWQDTYEKDNFAASPQLSRTNSRLTGFNGVGFTKHPRGPRFGSWAFRFPGLKTAVHVDGTLNNDKDKDKGWTVELCFPWKGMEWLAKADKRALPPENGDVWRIDFSRFNQYKAPTPEHDSGGWVWSKHGIWDSHIPECFPYVQFSTTDVTKAKPLNQ